MLNNKRISVGTKLNEELFLKLKELSNETKIPMTKLLDRGIELVLKEYQNK